MALLIIAAAVSLIKALAPELLAPEIRAALRRLSGLLLSAGVRVAPARRREQYKEEWAAELLCLVEQDRLLSAVVWSFGRLFGSSVDQLTCSRLLNNPVGSLARCLTWVAGADERVLDRVPSERSRFVGLGAAIAVAGVFAGFSVTVAMKMAGTPSTMLAIALGAIWAFMLLGLDRFSVTSMTRGRLRRLGAFAYHFVMTVMLSLWLVEPLVLQVFRSEIEATLIDDGATPPFGLVDRLTGMSDLAASNPGVHQVHGALVALYILIALGPMLLRFAMRRSRYDLLVAQDRALVTAEALVAAGQQPRI